MQVVILAGGFGTRLSEETDLVPKPMIRIGGEPILLHIIRYYAKFGHNEFLIAAGYKSEVIIEFFKNAALPWKVEVIDTGLEASTGGRLIRLQPYLAPKFMLTYGDGLGDINLDQLLEGFEKENFVAMVTAVRPPARFGSLKIQGNQVISFNEKNPQDEGWINGGFFICKKEILDYISSLTEPLEGKPLTALVRERMLGVYEHHGWWHPMDTLRDKRYLEDIWNKGAAPWSVGGLDE
jgi:glucose-1-phosphate cytidylyltransferase